MSVAAACSRPTATLAAFIAKYGEENNELNEQVMCLCLAADKDGVREGINVLSNTIYCDPSPGSAVVSESARLLIWDPYHTSNPTEWWKLSFKNEVT